MRDRLTVLAPVQNGSIWRVRIAWPIGTVHHFGKFTSEKDASDWIAAHAWLMECQKIPKPRPVNSVSSTRPRYRRLRLVAAPALVP